MNDLPTLVVAFNRTSSVEKTCQALVDLDTSRVFLAVDGPRQHVPSDRRAVDDVRRIAESRLGPRLAGVLSQKTNLGCALAVPSAVDWFFESVDSGLILEDDCVPTGAATSFAWSALRTFATEERVPIVALNSYTANPVVAAECPTFLTRFPHLWGWATTRAAWQQVKPSQERTMSARESHSWHSLSPLERRDWSRMFGRTIGPRPSSWAYAITASLWANGQFAVAPRFPLVRNIGFGEGATQTRIRENWYWEADDDTLAAFQNEIAALRIWPAVYDPREDFGVRRKVYSPPLGRRIWKKAFRKFSG